ncbi:hypothetical protein ACHAXH_007173 [Discostella pseudostelligera]
MDALAGYGSDSDNSDQVVPSPVDTSAVGVSSLLGHYSGDDSDEDKSGIFTPNKQVFKGEQKYGCQPNAKGEEAGQRADDYKQAHTASDGQHTKKRRKRWDNPNEDVLPDVIPPPTLLTDTTNHDPYHSLTLFQKDYTTKLRHKLSQQLQTHSQQYKTGGAASMENQQLIQTLEHLHDRFQQKKPSDGSDAHSAATLSTSSFAAHLKSKREFGNPHLLKTIIDHFHIQPLESHVGNTFKNFEYVDRLISAEERARAAAINYDASRGGDAGRMSGSGD